jgi:putative DNA methylase
MTDVDHPVVSPKKLIEVALPLDAINAACAREKSIRHGHPSTLHLWWARRPLAAARSVIFSQLVNDPEDLWRHQNPGKEPNAQVRGHWTKARARLFSLIEDLVLWENTTNEEVLNRAREEIKKSWREVCELNADHPQAAELFNPEKMPGLHDPFAGGGAIPLEAQRLGLEAYASDLNPVAVLINKAMIEIPPKFARQPPVHPDARKDKKLFDKEWKGAEGLAEDVRRYGQWMRDEAEKRIGHLYPKVEITAEMAKERPDLEPLVGQKLTVIAWLWARTVKSPNPAFSHVDVPLVSTFLLSRMKQREAYVEPVVREDSYRFTVHSGQPPADASSGTTLGKRKGFRCLLSGVPIGYDHIRERGQAEGLGERLMAIVAEGTRGRVYITPTIDQEEIARSAAPMWVPDLPLPENTRDFKTPNYGLKTFGDLFTPRQLVAMTTFSDLVGQVSIQIKRDALAVGLTDSDASPKDGPFSAKAYANAVSVYLGLVVSSFASRMSTISTWDAGGPTWGTKIGSLFGRQAIPMSWDYAEASPFSGQSGSFDNSLDYTCKGIAAVADLPGTVQQADAQTQNLSCGKVVSTDPPYYDNIGYADLSDFFYVWLRRALRHETSGLWATMATPKAEELVATPYRHKTKEGAEQFFLDGMKAAVSQLRKNSLLPTPITLYYAFKQAEAEGSNGVSSTGWETFLGAILQVGFGIFGTWPMRTELGNRLTSKGNNALASSVVLVCRPRAKNAGTISRKQFIRQLNATLPDALAKMTGAEMTDHSPVAPVDLSQAIIGPGMAIFSKYDAVLEADGTPMTVKTALQLINRFLAEDDFDADTQFCLHWFEQCGWDAGKFGEADTLARAKGTSVDGVKNAGVIESGSGSVRLLKWKEYEADWDASSDTRLPVWEALHQLIRAYSTGGDAGAAKVLAACASQAEAARQLAYRLYTLCERKGWAEDARAYNEVVTGWTGIEKAAVAGTASQRELFDA